jgi:hypothetical protein
MNPEVSPVRPSPIPTPTSVEIVPIIPPPVLVLVLLPPVVVELLPLLLLVVLLLLLVVVTMPVKIDPSASPIHFPTSVNAVFKKPAKPLGLAAGAGVVVLVVVLVAAALLGVGTDVGLAVVVDFAGAVVGVVATSSLLH